MYYIRATKIVEREVQELSDEYLEAHDFPQCISVIDGTHIEIAEPNENYSDLFDREDYFSLNVQVVYNYKYCFHYVVVKWTGSVNDTQIFLNSLINGMLQKRIIPTCEEDFGDGRNKRKKFF